MRRKVEILKYNANKSSTQTNSLTKKERFALLARGNRNMLSTQAINTCNSLPTPTSSSDVPGPVTYLNYDSTIPLYNYSEFNTRTYPEYVPNNEDPWQFIPIVTDIVIYNNNTKSLFYLIINNSVDQSKYNYRIIIPTGICIEGTIPKSYIPPTDFSGGILQMNITGATLSVFYSDKLVKNVYPTSLVNAKMTIIIPVGGNTTAAHSFDAKRFFGNLQFDNIELYTAPTYVYKFSLTVNVSISPNIDSNIISFVGLIGNMTGSGSSSTGCIILDSPSSDINSGPSISVI
jgi:hypothetical protein